MNLLIATNNKGKQAEIRALLDPLAGLTLLVPADIHLEMDVQESGQTYQENAVLKAKAFAAGSGYLSLADDSGLEVDALDGRPGVHSARFSSRPGATDADRRALLLEKLAVHPQPWTARFRCFVAMADPKGKLWIAEGICPGVIIPEEKGDNGFGYDPIFFMPEQGLTMAELPIEAKNTLSHRARAVLAAMPIIVKLLSEQAGN